MSDVFTDEGAHGGIKAAIWLTGLSGAGKSTIAEALAAELTSAGLRPYVLDGDVLREGISSDLGFSHEDRAENVRRVSEVARLMLDAGLVPIVALVSPFAADRDAARSRFPEHSFVEVHVSTPIEVCAARDVKGLYARSDAGEIPEMTGRGQAYEPPANPEVSVNGALELADCVEAILEAARAATRRQLR